MQGKDSHAKPWDPHCLLPTTKQAHFHFAQSSGITAWGISFVCLFAYFTERPFHLQPFPSPSFSNHSSFLWLFSCSISSPFSILPPGSRHSSPLAITIPKSVTSSSCTANDRQGPTGSCRRHPTAPVSCRDEQEVCWQQCGRACTSSSCQRASRAAPCQ